MEFIDLFLPFTLLKRTISLKAMWGEAISLQTAQVCETFLSIFLPFYIFKTMGRNNGNHSIKPFNNKDRRHDMKWFTKGQTENKKWQVGLSYSSQVYFLFIFCCNGDAPSKTTSHRRAHLFQPNAQPSMLREHFDGNRVWQGAFLTRCFIYLKWFNCFDLIQT